MTNDDELLHDYTLFYNNVARCYAYLLAGDTQSAHDLIALTAGQAIGLAMRLGLNTSTQPKHISQTKPWEKLNISRSTYYRDLRRAKGVNNHA